MARKISTTLKFTDSARFLPPQRDTRPGGSNHLPGEMIWEGSTQTLLVAKNNHVWDEVVLSVTQGTALSVTGINGRLTIGVDNTVLRTTGNFTVAGTHTYTQRLNASGAALRVPQGSSFPVAGNVEGDLFWRTDQRQLYIYSATYPGFVPPDGTTITAGDGLTGGGSGAVTLAVGAGDGITVNTDSIEVKLATVDSGLEFDVDGGLKVGTIASSVGSFAHTQSSPSATWTITHNLNVNKIICRVYDGTSEVSYETIDYSNVNILTLTFAAPQTGEAVILGFTF